jgi:G patch domain-containing protein 1
MDEEDLADLADSQQVATKETFSGIGSTEEDVRQRTAAEVFDEMLRPREDTIGVQILRKMGWREGQGVGPRIRRPMEDDVGGEIFELAPGNVEVVSLERKRDLHGLGYESQLGLERRVEKAVKKVGTTTTNVKGMRGSMGIGVLNEDDDDDPYDVGLTKDHYSKTVVSKRETTEKHTFKPAAKHTFTVKPKSTTSTTSIRRGHDGKLPLPGFTLSETPFTLTTEWYPPVASPSN